MGSPHLDTAPTKTHETKTSLNEIQVPTVDA